MRLILNMLAGVTFIVIIIGYDGKHPPCPDDFVYIFSHYMETLLPQYPYDYAIAIGPGV